MEHNYRYQTVLLVDDSELDNFINQKVMESNHFARHIYVCTNGESAIEFMRNIIIAREHKTEIFPDIIFVDLDMPIKDGFRFIEDLKKEIGEEIPLPKIVILSSSMNVFDKVKAEELDSAITFLNKPLKESLLVEL